MSLLSISSISTTLGRFRWIKGSTNGAKANKTSNVFYFIGLCCITLSRSASRGFLQSSNGVVDILSVLNNGFGGDRPNQHVIQSQFMRYGMRER